MDATTTRALRARQVRRRRARDGEARTVYRIFSRGRRVQYKMRHPRGQRA